MKNRNKEKFCDRINYLANLFGCDELAFYLSQDVVDVMRWSNSVTLVDAPVMIDYTYFLHKNPEFNRDWLKQGIGDRFFSGTIEENEKIIKDREIQKKVDKVKA